MNSLRSTSPQRSLRSNPENQSFAQILKTLRSILVKTQLFTETKTLSPGSSGLRSLPSPRLHLGGAACVAARAELHSPAWRADSCQPSQRGCFWELASPFILLTPCRLLTTLRGLWVHSENKYKRALLPMRREPPFNPFEQPKVLYDVNLEAGNLWAYVFHRITEWLGLEGTSVGHPVQPPAEAGSPTAGRTGPRVLNISREGDSTTSLGSLFQGSVTLRGKKFFHMFRWNFLCTSRSSAMANTESCPRKE